MPTLCDANLLLALCYDRHIHHTTALAWLDAQEPDEVVVCRSAQLSLLRLLCHAVVMGEDVCTQAQAWTVYDAILGDERFTFYPEPEGLEILLRVYTQSGLASPNLWPDAYLAAFARAADLQMATFDKGFKQFDGLRLVKLEI
jgi:toxin-antitoxin system PIN domain toxin